MPRPIRKSLIRIGSLLAVCVAVWTSLTEPVSGQIFSSTGLPDLFDAGHSTPPPPPQQQQKLPGTDLGDAQRAHYEESLRTLNTRSKPFADHALDVRKVSFPFRDSRFDSSPTLSPGFEAIRPEFEIPPFDPSSVIAPRSTITTEYDVSGLARGFYSNDQRIEFTGQEATFGVEGVLAGAIARHECGWDYGVFGEVYFNQPFDRNLLVDTAERVSYRGNFEINTFEISQLYLKARHGNWNIELGKILTPFGRFYYPLLTNPQFDAPFIRTESIAIRETGLIVNWEPGIWRLMAGITNGGLDRDANSSKAFIGRAGYDTGTWAAGASVKWQDGIGSEGQKTYKNHLGLDLAWRHGPWSVSGEVLYDEYGFRRPGFNPLDITWGRSIYNRDLNHGLFNPITGWGYYANVNYELPTWTIVLNYGEFYPEQIGNSIHDQANRRFITKGIKHLSESFDFYAMLLLENDVENAQAGRKRNGNWFLTGFQFGF